MKQFFLLNVCLFSFLITSLTAQEDLRAIGVRFSVPSNFGLIYKKQRAENNFLRITAGRFSISTNNNISTLVNQNVNTTIANVSAGATIGLEKRIPINDKFNLIRGGSFIANGGFSYVGNTISSNALYYFSVGYGYLLGAQYRLNEHMYIDLEILPTATLGISSNNQLSNQIVFNSNFNMYNIYLNFSYEFMQPEKQGKVKTKNAKKPQKSKRK